jgi:hypothetical protein
LLDQVKIFLSLAVLVAIGAGSAFSATLPERRLQRRHEHVLDYSKYIGESRVGWRISESCANAKRLFSDAQVYDDNTAASFSQRYPHIARFSDGRKVAVWEDKRNGDWDIFAQAFASDGSPSGANFRIASDAYFFSQRQPQAAVDDNDHLIVVWAEEETGHCYGSVFGSDLSALVENTQLDDGPAGNMTNAPAVAASPAGGFVVAWEDARSGANIYAQRISSVGVPVGANFRVNEDIYTTQRLSPAAAFSDDGSFVITWDDPRDGDNDVYFKLYNSSGTPITTDVKPVDVPYDGSYQFDGRVAYISSLGYVVAWISDRDGGQGVYAQLVAGNGSLINNNFQLNDSDSDVCWDLNSERVVGAGAACVWVNLSATAEVVLQLLDTGGLLSGSNNQVQDAAASGVRGSPAPALSSSGGLIVWSDTRNYDSDIYGQELDSGFFKVDVNFRVNDDQLGSQQLAPDITALPSSRAAIVWQDNRTDNGDILMQLINYSGDLIEVLEKANDDAFKAVQANPSIASSYISGTAVVVWEDRRADAGLSGQNIFGQRFANSGFPLASNFLINDDGTSAPKSEPDVSVSDNDLFAVVWSDERNGHKVIYLSFFTSSGFPVGANRIVSVVSGASESFEPHISMRADGSFVVTWTSIIGQRRAQYFRQYNSDGDAVGGVTPVSVDTSQVDVEDADVFAQRSTGNFFIGLITMQSGGRQIEVLRYDQDGVFNGVMATAYDGDSSSVSDLRLTGDYSDAVLVSWTDRRDGFRCAYAQLVHEQGYKIGDNVQISQSGLDVDEMSPAVTMRGGYYVSTWVDNRNPGRGYDLFANSVLYTSQEAGSDESPLPSAFMLDQNYPNPFNPSTVISYRLDRPGLVTLDVLNVLGQKVKTLFSGYQQQGGYRLTWDGIDSQGNQVAGGVYFYRINADKQSLTRKMLLLK